MEGIAIKKVEETLPYDERILNLFDPRLIEYVTSFGDYLLGFYLVNDVVNAKDKVLRIEVTPKEVIVGYYSDEAIRRKRDIKEIIFSYKRFEPREEEGPYRPVEVFVPGVYTTSRRIYFYYDERDGRILYTTMNIGPHCFISYADEFEDVQKKLKDLLPNEIKSDEPILLYVARFPDPEIYRKNPNWHYDWERRDFSKYIHPNLLTDLRNMGINYTRVTSFAAEMIDEKKKRYIYLNGCTSEHSLSFRSPDPSLYYLSMMVNPGVYAFAHFLPGGTYTQKEILKVLQLLKFPIREKGER
jgi:hypothetical protein